MAKNEQNMWFSELAAFAIEKETSPNHVGGIQIYEPQNEKSSTAARRIYKDFLNSEVGEPFNKTPVFRKLKLPKWSTSTTIDVTQHVKFLKLDPPGSLQQLLDIVAKLHEPLMDRDAPGWENYIIDGLVDNRFAIYEKYHHAYIDGATYGLRSDRIMGDSPGKKKAVPMWSPMDLTQESAPDGDTGAKKSRGPSIFGTLKDVNMLLGKTVLQATGYREGEAPLPFSAPRSMVNKFEHASRALGAGSIDLAKVKQIAKNQSVSINEVMLAVIGAAVERYLNGRGEYPDRDLVAGCPMSIRREDDAARGNQIAALFVRLGTPGSSVPERLKQVHASSRDAKAAARSVGRGGLMGYQTVVMGVAALIGISPFADRVLPLSNINVSNVAGAPQELYFGGAKLQRVIATSTLQGSAINITCCSAAGRMEYGIISDAMVIPDPSRIADLIVEAFEELMESLTSKGKRPKRKTSANKSRSAGAHAK